MQQAQPSDAKSANRSEASNVPVRKECNIPGKQAYMLWHTLFEIDEVYQPIKAIGKGAYGVVCSAKNMATGEKVAIKKITNAFDNLTDAKRTLREIKLLRHLRQENIIAIMDIMQPTNKDKFNDVYLVNELMDTDLHQIIRSSQPLSDDHYQYFVYQVMLMIRTSMNVTTNQHVLTVHGLMPDLERLEVYTHGKCAAQRPEAQQSSAECFL